MICQYHELDEFDLFDGQVQVGTPADCPNEATHVSCKPFLDTPTCEAHKCRCAKLIGAQNSAPDRADNKGESQCADLGKTPGPGIPGKASTTEQEATRREDWGQSCAECGAQWMIGAQIDKASDLIEPYRVRARDAEARVAEFESKAQHLADRIGYKPCGPRPATAWELLETVVDNALAQWANDIVDLHGLRATLRATHAAVRNEKNVSSACAVRIHELSDDLHVLRATVKAMRVERNEDDRCVWRSGWYAASVGHAASANPYLEPVPPGELETEP